MTAAPAQDVCPRSQMSTPVPYDTAGDVAYGDILGPLQPCEAASLLAHLASGETRARQAAAELQPGDPRWDERLTLVKETGRIAADAHQEAVDRLMNDQGEPVAEFLERTTAESQATTTSQGTCDCGLPACASGALPNALEAHAEPEAAS